MRLIPVKQVHSSIIWSCLNAARSQLKITWLVKPITQYYILVVMAGLNPSDTDDFEGRANNRRVQLEVNGQPQIQNP